MANQYYGHCWLTNIIKQLWIRNQSEGTKSTGTQGTIRHATKSPQGKLQKPNNMYTAQEPRKPFTEPSPPMSTGHWLHHPNFIYSTSTSPSPNDFMQAYSNQILTTNLPMSTRDQDRKEHGQRVHPIQQRLLGAMTKSLYGKPLQPMHTVQTHAQMKPHDKCSTGQ